MSPALSPCPRRPARRPAAAWSVALWSVLAAGALAACQSATAPASAPTPPLPTTPTTPTTPEPPTPPAPTQPAPTQPAPTQPAPPATVVPAVLLGEWTYGSPDAKVTDRHRSEFFKGSWYYYVDRSAANFYLTTFHADGRYDQLWYNLAGRGGCVAESWKEVHGTASFGDGTFGLTAASGRWKYLHKCDGQVRISYDRPMTADELAGERRDHLWRFETNPNDGRTYLMIGYGTSYTGDLVQLHFERPR